MNPDERSNAPGGTPGQPEKKFGNRPEDPPPDDPIEQLGKRIGRALSYVLAAALVVYLWYTYLRG